MKRNDSTTWVGEPKPSPSAKLASAYTPVRETDPEILAAAMRTLQQCGAVDLAPMLGLDSPGPTHQFGSGQ